MQKTAEAAYLEDGSRLAEGLRLGGVGVWRWQVDTGRLDWTDNLERIHHLPPGSFDGTVASFGNDIHPDDAETVWAAIQKCIETGTPYRAAYRTAPRGNEPPQWIEATGGLVSDDGDRYLTGVCQDITERVVRDREIDRRLRQQQAIADFGSFAFGESSLARTLDRAVVLAADVLEVPLTKILRFADAADSLLLAAGVGWGDGVVGKATVGIDMDSQAGFTLTCNVPVVVEDLLSETRFSGPPLLREYGVRSGISVTIAGSDKRPFGVFGIHTTEPRPFDEADVGFLLALANIVANSARHHQEDERQVLLLREMAHRSGNLLQMVNAIATQTFREGGDAGEARRSFSERLSSLSRANYLIARGGWTTTRFAALIAETLEPFASRLDLAGRDILLPAELSFDLGLVLHELATNSVKYGTLGSEDGGKVALRWQITGDGRSGDMFSCEWHDRVSRPGVNGAGGGGFGRRLFSGLIEQKWEGRIAVETVDGYRFRLEIPLNRSRDTG